MLVARIASLALRDARHLPADEWFPVLSSGDFPTPPHYLWLEIDAEPSLVWSGHLYLDTDPSPVECLRNRVRSARRRATVLREQAGHNLALGRYLSSLARRSIARVHTRPAPLD